MTRSLQVVLSVFGWWVLVVLPSVLTLAGVFGEVDEDTELSGWIVLVWVGCYLAQLAMVFVIARAVGHTRSWWFFLASLLPWVVDWSVPVGWGWALLWIGVAGIVATAMILLSLRSLRLDLDGTVVTGTVVTVLKGRFNTVVNNVYIRRRVVFEVPGAQGSYQVTMPMLCEIGTTPDPGDTYRLRVDPRNPKHVALDPSHFQRDDD